MSLRQLWAFLAVALSDRVFEDVLASGYAKLPTTKVVPADVRIKEYRGTVYLYIPNPSGDLLRHGAGAGYAEELAAAKATIEPAPGSVTNVISGPQHGTAIQVGHVHGNFGHR